MNKIILSGRVVRDAELSYIPGSGTAKMSYSLAVERKYQKDKNNKKVDFINCEAIGKHCEKLCQYVLKGKMVIVEGELNIDQYQKDGENKSFTKVKVDSLEFVGGGEKKEDNQSQGFEPQGFQAIDDLEDSIPF